MNEIVTRIEQLPTSHWNLHEVQFCQRIGITSKEGLSAHFQLSEFVSFLQNGGCGRKRDDTYTGCDKGKIDLAGYNILGLRMEKYGQIEIIEKVRLSDATIKQRPRWFKLGNSQITPRNQYKLLSAVTGEEKHDTKDPEVLERRKKTYLEWYRKEGDGYLSYLSDDLPGIALFFREFWPGKENDISQVAKLVRLLHEDSNKIPKRRDNMPVLPEVPILLDHGQAQSTIPRDSLITPPTGTPPLTGGALPDPLKIAQLRGMLEENMDDLASLEYMYIHSGEQTDIEKHKSALELLGFQSPTTQTINQLCGLNARQRSNVTANMAQIRKEICKQLPGGLFSMSDDQLLVHWICDGRRYSKGVRLSADNYYIHPDNNKPCLTDEGAHCLRHMLFCYNLSIIRLPALWNCFAVLLLGRGMKDEEFSSLQTIRNRIQRLHHIDEIRFSHEFEQLISKATPNGFKLLFYTVSDDSKHKKRSRHAVLMSTPSTKDMDAEEQDYPTPSFRLLTTDEALTTDSDGNSDLNLKTLMNAVSVKSLTHYGGNVSDNANDAVKEGKLTFQKLMRTLPLEDQKLYGVERLPIIFGDPYHNDNLCMQHASLASWGETERDNHSEVHHRQMMQSLHDIHASDRIFSQNAMDSVLKDSEHGSVKVKTTRERQQRWMVNQRFAGWIYKHVEDVKTAEGHPALVAWAKYMFQTTDSAWVKRAAKEVMLMLLNKNVFIGIIFEMELGAYFETTMAWHCRKGALSKRTGFRMMELHQFYHVFLAPFWNQAIQSPEVRFPKTFEYLNNIIQQEHRETKRSQIVEGIKAGHKEFQKMYAELFRAPLIFLILSDAVRGPPLLRVLVTILEESDFDMTGDGWGRYDPFDPDSDNQSELGEAYYNLLKDDGDSVKHWYQQLGLAKEIVRDELILLSNKQQESYSDSDGDGIAILQFALAYPVIFEALGATFRYMMSNSRMAELMHAGLRQTIKEGEALFMTEMSRAYMTNEEYYHREERRDLERSKQEETKKKTSVKHDRSKEQQIRVSEQLIESCTGYSRKSLVKLEQASGRKIQPVGFFKKRGITFKDKELQAKRARLQEEKQARRRDQNEVNLDEAQEEAEQLVLRNDEDWKSVADKQKEWEIEKLANASFWKSLKVKDGFDQILRDVIPSFQRDASDTSKTKVIPKLTSHLKLIALISKREVANTLSPGTDLNDKSRIDILAFFVKREKTTILSEKESLSDESKSAYDAIMVACGTVPHTRYLSESRFDGDRLEDYSNDAPNFVEEDE
jgi:hypothetical protein